MHELIYDPTFWVAIAFLVFVVLVFKPMKLTVLSGLDAKISNIRQEVEEAEKLREEAQSLLAKYQRQQRQAQEDAETIIARAREEADQHRINAETAIKEMIRRQEDQAREKIKQAEAAAVQQVREYSVDLAMAAAETLLTDQLSGEKGARLLDKNIEEISRKIQ